MQVRRHQRGFNLIEAMMAVGILALLTAVAVPGLADWIRNTNVRTLGESMQNGLQRARNEAMRRNRTVTFWLVTPGAPGVMNSDCALSATSASWVVSVDSPAGACAAEPSTTAAPRLVESFAVPPAAVSITVAAKASDGTTDATSVTFNGLGQAVQTGTPLSIIDLTHAESGVRRLRVRITNNGGIRMCDRDVATGDPRACT